MKNSINNTKNFISLPIFPDLTYRDVDKISELINKYFNDLTAHQPAYIPVWAGLIHIKYIYRMFSFFLMMYNMYPKIL